MTASGRSNARPVGPTHRLSEVQPLSLGAFVAGRPAYLIGRAVGRWIADPPVRVRVTRDPQRQADGSSSTTRGAGASRSWSVTASWSTGCLALVRVKCDSGSPSGTSARGRATTKTSDSSRSYPGEAGTIGREVRTPADPPQHPSPGHYEIWGEYA